MVLTKDKILQIQQSNHRVIFFDQNGFNSTLSQNLGCVETDILSEYGVVDEFLAGNKISKLVIVNLGFNLKIHLNLEKNQNLQMLYFGFGSGDFVLDVNLIGEDSKLILSTLLDLENDIKNNTQITIHHQASKTDSSCNFKNIISDNAKLILNTQIQVDSNIYQINSSLKIKTLKLSSLANISVRPDLKIYSKEVNCSHSNTISNLDKDQLFYLNSRGLDNFQAQNIILQGFASDIYTIL
jgi:hypothetical protein